MCHTAKIAGILAAKNTSSQIPLTHHVPLDHVTINFILKNKCYIYQPLNNWNETVIQPAIEYIKKLNNISFRKRLKSVVIKNNHITRLNFSDSEIDIKEKDFVISALPLNSFSKIFPKNNYPEKFNSILNLSLIHI